MSILTDIAETLRSLPSVSRYELYCHPSVYIAIQRLAPAYTCWGTPYQAIYGADIITAPELGTGVWELYGNGKLVGYGKIHE